MGKEQRIIIPKELKANRNNLVSKLEQIMKDPELRLRGEKFHKEISSPSPERLLRPFDV